MRRGLTLHAETARKRLVVPLPVSHLRATYVQGGGGYAGACQIGDRGPGGGVVFYVNETNPTGTRYMEAVAGTDKGWDDGNAKANYTWCLGYGDRVVG